MPEDRFCLIVMEIVRKLSRTVQIDQSMMSAVPQRQDADALAVEFAVPETHRIAHFDDAVIAAAEQISGFDAGECRRAVANHCFFGHGTAPFIQLSNANYFIIA